MTEPRPLPYAWDDLHGRLEARLEGVLASFGIGAADGLGRGIVTPLNPGRADRARGSFVIFCNGRRPGCWEDFATGERGDLFDLAALYLRLSTKMDGYWWALKFLGLGDHAVTAAGADQLAAERRRRDAAAAKARQAAAEADKSAELFKRWLKMAPIAGTPVETYLVAARGIDLSRLPRAVRALRFHPALDHTDSETGEVTRWPAMVACMTRGDKASALHRTWLTADGMAKAPVRKAKMMLGKALGAAIRLTRGASGLTPAAAAERGRLGPLILGEGIETTLSCAVARPDYRAWAAGSTVGMGGLDWPACASGVVLLQDNDPDPAPFARVEAHWRALAEGRPVKVVASLVGKDFNDWARSDGA